MSLDRSSTILLTINAASDADQQELEDLSQSLLDELDPIASVSRVHTENAPVGSKAMDASIVGQLAFSLINSGGVLVTVIGAAQAWLLRQNARSIIIELEGNKIEVKGTSSEEQRQLIDTWIVHVKEAAQRESDRNS